VFYFERPIHIEGIASVFVKRLKEGYMFSGHIHHVNWEMVYVVDGCVGVTAGDRVVKCRAGTIIFHQPNEFHRIWNSENGESVIMIVSFLIKGASIDCLREKIITLTDDEQSTMHKLHDMIMENAVELHGELSAKPSFHGNHFLSAQFCTLLEHQLYRCATSNNFVISKATKNSSLFSRAVNSMKSHIGDNLTIKEFADELQISQSHLKRLFQRYAQTGVHEYFLTLKVNHAKTLLSQGESVYHTALAVGFEDQNYFSTAFKRITGVPPSKWIETD
jgi:AraC-like DNA-binding protein